VESIQPRYPFTETTDEDERKERHSMGQISGDKAGYNRKRRKKIARRVKMRALRETLGTTGATPQPKASAATKS
jgi:hypothetical protein